MVSLALSLDVLFDVAQIIRISGLIYRANIDSDLDLKINDKDLMKSIMNEDKAFHKECYFDDESISFE